MIERISCILSLPKEFLEIWAAEKNKEHPSQLANSELRFSHVPPLHSFIEIIYHLPDGLMTNPPVPGIAGDCLPFEVKRINYMFWGRDKIADVKLHLEIEPVAVSNIVKIDKEQIAKGLPTNIPIFFDFLKRTGWG